MSGMTSTSSDTASTAPFYAQLTVFQEHRSSFGRDRCEWAAYRTRRNMTRRNERHPTRSRLSKKVHIHQPVSDLTYASPSLVVEGVATSLT